MSRIPHPRGWPGALTRITGRPGHRRQPPPGDSAGDTRSADFCPAGQLSFWRIVNVPFGAWLAALERRQLTRPGSESRLGRSLLRGPAEHDHHFGTCQIQARPALGPLPPGADAAQHRLLVPHRHRRRAHPMPEGEAHHRVLPGRPPPARRPDRALPRQPWLRPTPAGQGTTPGATASPPRPTSLSGPSRTCSASAAHRPACPVQAGRTRASSQATGCTRLADPAASHEPEPYQGADRDHPPIPQQGCPRRRTAGRRAGPPDLEGAGPRGTPAACGSRRPSQAPGPAAVPPGDCLKTMSYAPGNRTAASPPRLSSASCARTA